MTKKFIIAITGKQGSGKSSLSNELARELNGSVFNLDIYSHKALQNKQVQTAIIKVFGDKIIKNGKLDRKEIGKIAFNNKDKLNFLNSITYKQMQIDLDLDLEKAKDIIILDYALLPLTKYFNISNYKILMQANKDIRLKRLIERDKLDKDYLEKRENKSIEYNYEFDKIIDSSTTLNMKEIAKQIHQAINNLRNIK